jgi:predicted peptidase
MVRRFALVTWLFVLYASLVFAADKAQTGFLNRTITVEGSTYPYVVYVPSDWTPQQKWPVILFLHGAGERGSDGLKQSEVGLGRAVRLHPERFPFIVVMPQCPEGLWWPQAAMEKMALAALDAEIHEYNGDPSRIYLTGLSMGGYGTWAIAANNPAKFAAIAPVCGGVSISEHLAKLTGFPVTHDASVFTETAQKVRNIPVWIYHGGADPTVPVTESQNMTKALQQLGADVSYTEYPGLGHNSWDSAYGEADFPQWLLAQQLKP